MKKILWKQSAVSSSCSEPLLVRLTKFASKGIHRHACMIWLSTRLLIKRTFMLEKSLYLWIAYHSYHIPCNFKKKIYSMHMNNNLCALWNKLFSSISTYQSPCFYKGINKWKTGGGGIYPTPPPTLLRWWCSYYGLPFDSKLSVGLHQSKWVVPK